MIICLAIPSLGVGGMERVMSEIASDFAKRDQLELHIILFGRKRNIFYDIPKNVFVHKPPFEYDASKRTFMTLRTIWFIRSEVKIISPNVVLSFGEIWNNLVLLSLLGLKYPVCISDRCRPDLSFGKIQDWLRCKLYPKAKCVIAQTDKAKDIYSTQFKHDNIIVIGNPIRSIREDATIKKENIIVSVGRLISSKNYDQLIRIFASIQKPDWKLIIVGGDANKQNNSLFLQDMIDKLGLKDQISLAGTQKDVDSYLMRSKIFAFTSSSEGFPNVIGEAMNAGIPVVAYDCIAGPSDLIEDGRNGFLIPLFDEQSFSLKLRLLMDYEEKTIAMGQYARESIKRYSLDIIAEQYYNILIENSIR